jgi:hypothetical protein
MRKRIVSLVITAILSCCLLPAGTSAEQPTGRLEFLQPLIGQKWLGHFSNPEDAYLNHYNEWESILEGQAVKATKQVPEVNFTRETLYYWDPESKQVQFLSVTSKGQVSRGTVTAESGLITLLGVNLSESGRKQFKTTYELLTTGELLDRFYVQTGQDWRQGHLIRYGAVGESNDPGTAP